MMSSCLVCSKSYTQTKQMAYNSRRHPNTKQGCCCSRECAAKWKQCETGRKHKCKVCNKKTGWVRGGDIVCFACAKKKTTHTGQCEHCKTQFTKTQATQKYCSMQCVRKDRASKRMRLCKKCKQLFAPKSTRQLTFCSRVCSGKGELGQERGKAKQLEAKRASVLRALNKRARQDERAWVAEQKRYCKCGNEATRRAYCDGCAKKRKLQIKALQNRKYKAFRDTDIRNTVITRDGGVCQFCGVKPRQCTVDHLIPLARGGTDDASNLAVACRRCNSIKHTKTPLELFNWPKWIACKYGQKSTRVTGPSQG